MYTKFFRLTHSPFSISPDPRYLFMSERHREALAHLLYGVDSGGGIVLLTGNIGTGKTTICRCFLAQVPANCNVAYIFNPKLTVAELLRSICEEFRIKPLRRETAGAKDYIDALNLYLLAEHAEGRNNVLVIDEAQNLSADVLEQLRLLTNLETNERKLLQIILIGQPELRTMLSRTRLEQLAQRVIAHYHLTALSEQETGSYIQHRLTTAGLTAASPFQQPLIKEIHRLTRGVPRRINLLCDRALLGAYATGKHEVDRAIIEQAAAELFINQRELHASLRSRRRWSWQHTALLVGCCMLIGPVAWALINGSMFKSTPSGWIKSAGKITVAKDKPAETMQPILSEKKGVFSSPLRDSKEAIRQLGHLWNLTLEGDSPCETAMRLNVRCYPSHGGFAELRQLDRPAILKLHDEAQKPFYALLIGISETSATLRAGDASQDISLAMLTRYFNGEFTTLWHTPPGFDDKIEVGDKGPAVNWLALKLEKLYGTAPQLPDQPFDQKMLKQIRHFQQVHGLSVDGIAGPTTLMQINHAAGSKEPHLNSKLSVQPDHATPME